MSQSHTGSERQAASSDAPRTPRWVKVAGVIVVVAILLIGIILATGLGGSHGPGRHQPSGRAPQATPVGALDQPPDGWAGPSATSTIAGQCA